MRYDFHIRRTIYAANVLQGVSEEGARRLANGGAYVDDTARHCARTLNRYAGREFVCCCCRQPSPVRWCRACREFVGDPSLAEVAR